MKNPSLTSSLKNKYGFFFTIIFCLVFFSIFTTISLHRFWQYETWYYDFGIYFQAIAAVAQGKTPIIDHFVFPGIHIWGDHFAPIIFLLSPLWAITQKAEVLLLAQTFCVSLSGVFIYLTAKKITKSQLQSFLLTVIYLSFLGLHNALITEFHPVVLLPFPLSIFYYGMIKKSPGFFLNGLIGVLLIKETTFIITAWLGLWMFIKYRGKWRLMGFATATISIIYGLITLTIIIPSFNPGGYHYLNSDTKIILNEILTPRKLLTIKQTFSSFSWLPILSPGLLPPVIINWWSRFTLGGPRDDLGMHYNAEIAPTLAIATIFGWQRLKKILKKIYALKIFQTKTSLNLILILLTFWSLFLSIYILRSPALLFFNKSFYQHTNNFKFLNKLITKIPSEGTVMAQHNIAGKLAYRKVYILRESYQQFSPDFIVIDTRDGQGPNNILGITNFPKLIETIKTDPNYHLYYDQGEQMIFEKIK